MASPRWWTKDTIAVVTGANKGIGFEIAKQLALNGLTVIITARDQQRGLNALAQLKDLIGSASSNIVFHLLDVNNPESIFNFASWLTKQYKGVDILVNNAAVADSDSSYENARLVLDTNYVGVKRVTEALLPCMKASAVGARIVNVSSGLGQIQMLSPPLQQEMENPERLSEEKIDVFVNRFLQDAKEGNASNKRWIIGEYSALYPAYSVSKVALNAYSRILAKKLQDRPNGEKIYVNCLNPGYCKTDLNNNQGHLTPAEGADTAVWLALLHPPVPNGEFFSKRKPYQF